MRNKDNAKATSSLPIIMEEEETYYNEDEQKKYKSPEEAEEKMMNQILTIFDINRFILLFLFLDMDNIV